MYWLAILTLIILVPFLLVVLTGAPYVPTFRRDLAEIFKEVKLPKDALVIDLGSGDGRLVVMAAKKGYRAVGYEINPFLWIISVIRLRKYPHAQVRLKSFWAADVAEADLVFTFLNKIYSARLEKKLIVEMKPNSWFASYGFAYGNLELVKKIRASHIYRINS